MYSLLKKMIITLAAALSLNVVAKTEIEFWSFTRAFDPFIEDFHKNNPDIQVNFTVFPFAQYSPKIIAALRSPKTAPTLFVAEVNFVGQFVKQNIWMPLDDFEGFKDQQKNFFPYAWDVGLNDKNQLVAVTWQANPIGFFYNREVAKKVLGTDDYQEISQKMDNFDNILDALRQAKKETGQSYYVFWGDSGLSSIMQAKYQQPYVENSKLTTGAMIDELFDLYIKFAKEKAIIYPENDDPLFKAINQGKVLGIYTAPWILGSKFKAYRPEGAGNWGLATSPYVAIRGGTWVGISNTEKDKKKIKAAAKFLTDLITNVETSQKFIVTRGDIPTNKIIYENIKNNTDPYLDNQPLVKPLAHNLDEARLFTTPHDTQIRTAIQNVLEKILNNPNDWTIKNAVKEYKKQVSLILPDIIVE